MHVLTASEISKLPGVKRVEVIGGQTLIEADCLEVMPLLGRFDAVVTDPPYGIGVDRAMAAGSGTKYGKSAAAKRQYVSKGWDDQPIGDDHLSLIHAASNNAIIFGGNYFNLPPSRCWLVWDKRNGTNAFADCELAWTNLDMPVRRIEWMWNGMLRQGQEERNGHPTQKPLAVMEWCLGFLPKAQTILDPFAGSGTTAVACQRVGKHSTCIERDPDYFEVMCKRVDEATRQPDMFVQQAAPSHTQEPLL